MSTLHPSEQNTAAGPDTLRRLGGSLAHHVNNALTGVVGYLELALRAAPPAGPARDHLLAALRCAHQAADTVKRIVSFACHAPTAERTAPVSLRELAEQAAERLRLQAPPGVGVEVRANGPGWVTASAHLLRTALEQLGRNALEAMPHGGRLTLRVEEKAGRHTLSVADTGAGLSAEARAHLFEPFWTNKPTGHLGVGLLLCREVVAAQGGTLQLTGAEGQGTTATMSLPAVVESAAIRVDDRQGLPASPHWPQVAFGVPPG
ncbi:MAG TPA: HAMP domain-containing sensor histidine kinase [Gemmataceae bacterium]|jgi:signal transduction histidine kinase|nr:HAMP domain-containing sensor histidine kinase [Gemmataceae bacterium]